MGLFNTFMSLIEEGSDNTFEKKMNAALDKIEHTIGATVDKAETNIKKIDTVRQKAEASGKFVERITKIAEGE
jgi:hypothetical protein